MAELQSNSGVQNVSLTELPQIIVTGGKKVHALWKLELISNFLALPLDKQFCSAKDWIIHPTSPISNEIC